MTRFGDVAAAVDDEMTTVAKGMGGTNCTMSPPCAGEYEASRRDAAQQ